MAGGSNERLKSVIPSFHKPLLVINGRPLVVDIVDKLLQATSSSDRVIVVCSPHNVNAIADVVSRVALTGADEIDFVVQPQPIGIVDATVRGLRAAGKSARGRTRWGAADRRGDRAGVGLAEREVAALRAERRPVGYPWKRAANTNQSPISP